MKSPAKLLHILGGGPWQVPSVQLAKSLGYRVLVTDMYKDRPAYAFADDHEVVDVTDLSATLAVAQKHRIDGILCDTTDTGVPTAAYVAEQLGLPGIGYDVALGFTNKYAMRAKLRGTGLPMPKFHLVRTLDDLRNAATDLGYPLILKPVDNQSSRGVRPIESAASLETSFAESLRHSRNRELIAEQYVQGTEITVEAICVAGQVHTLAVSDKCPSETNPTVAASLTYPADFGPEIFAQIRTVNEHVIASLGLCNGVTHAEYIVANDGIVLLEIAARGGGARIYTDIVPYLSGVPVPQAFMQYVMSDGFEVRPRAGLRAANLAFLTTPFGKVSSIEGLDAARAIPGVIEVAPQFRVGDTLQAVADKDARACRVIVLGHSRAEVLEISDRVRQTVRVHVAGN